MLDHLNKRTVVLGATTNPARAAYAAVQRMVGQGVDVIPIGIREGTIAGIPIRQGQPELSDVHTVTLYLNPGRQQPYYSYILQTLKPKRLIFNPGTENPELAGQARQQGIEVDIACTLVMLAVGSY